MTGLWLLPTKGRPSQVARFFEQWRKTSANTPGIVIINSDENADLYKEVPLPSNWSIVQVTATCVADAVNTAILPYVDSDWIGLLCDDHLPETMEWDTKLVERSKPHAIVASANGSQENRLHGALVYGGQLLRTVGWMYPPGVKHSFHDDAWEMLGDRCQNIIKVEEVMVRHLHAGTVDETGRKRNSYWNNDERAYRTWLLRDGADTVKRVTQMMEAAGLVSAPPSLADRSLMIVSPNYDSKFEREFVFSIQKTLDLLRALNIKVEFTDAPGIAEPGFARATILGAFRRSPHTDLLMIDNDMGWSARDLLRLLSANMPLVAVAGPRKLDRPAFAAHITKEDANAMYIDEKAGAMALTEVGAAFMLISKGCADQVCAANTDLEFDAEHGAVETDVFRNVIVQREGRRVRLSEDYSFCWRARQIGIRTMVLPDISLQHVGRKVWAGALGDILKAPVTPPAIEAAD